MFDAQATISADGLTLALTGEPEGSARRRPGEVDLGGALSEERCG